MKNIYKITKSQLAVLWLFMITLFTLIEKSAGSYYCYKIDFGKNCHQYFQSFLLLFLPFLIIFYSIGWNNYNKNRKEDIK
ncbi:MAG: hypothetical protein NTW62_03220 [Candidatus Nomurabacteria bacterium]|nr:hypothetical protein [Candidatus Nomurabacteria bacterium]